MGETGQKMLDRVNDSFNRLDELERSYSEQKELLIGELSSYLTELGQVVDSQAARAQVIRRFYWQTRISASIVAEAFKLTQGRVRKIAGDWEVKKPCAGKCGRSGSRVYKSRNQLDSSGFEPFYCEDCSAKRKREAEETSARKEREAEEAYARQQRAEKQRSRELLSMTWLEYIETGEWEGIRERVLNICGYRCQICERGQITLNVFPHRDTPQCMYGGSSRFTYFVLCNECVPRCLDLIDENKREIIKAAFLALIKSESDGYYIREMM